MTGSEILPLAMPSSISFWRRWYTRGVQVTRRRTKRITLAVVSDPAMIWSTISASHCFLGRPWRMNEPWLPYQRGLIISQDGHRIDNLPAYPSCHLYQLQQSVHLPAVWQAYRAHSDHQSPATTLPQSSLLTPTSLLGRWDQSASVPQAWLQNPRREAFRSTRRQTPALE